jgi:hypothetical protein
MPKSSEVNYSVSAETKRGFPANRSCEPVSTSNSLIIRENTGNFIDCEVI